MARRPRVEYPDAFYHVIARGNKREDIFLEDGDRKKFLEKLEEYKKRYISYKTINSGVISRIDRRDNLF